MGTATYLIAIGSNRRTQWGSPVSFLTHLLILPQPADGHAELVSASISQEARTTRAATWTLKRVQSDGIRIVAASVILTSRPLGPGKRSYANAVALIASDLSPPEMLAHLKGIEGAHGRRAGRRWGDRPLDLDIIGWSGGIWATRTLFIPHPAFRERRFVLGPLVEVASDWRDPVTHLTARQLLARLDRQRPRA